MNISIEVMNEIDNIFNRLCEYEAFREWALWGFQEGSLNDYNEEDKIYTIDVLDTLLSWTSGSYKWVFFVDDYVVKIPFDNSNDCTKEEKFYHGVPDEFKRSFAECQCFSYNNKRYKDIEFNFWVAPCYCVDENEYDEKGFYQYVEECYKDGDISKEEYDVIINDYYADEDITSDIRDEYCDHTSNYKARLLFRYLYDDDYADRLIDYINSTNLGDLHGENIGFDRSGMPVIIDISWY